MVELNAELEWLDSCEERLLNADMIRLDDDMNLKLLEQYYVSYSYDI